MQWNNICMHAVQNLKLQSEAKLKLQINITQDYWVFLKITNSIK